MDALSQLVNMLNPMLVNTAFIVLILVAVALIVLLFIRAFQKPSRKTSTSLNKNGFKHESEPVFSPEDECSLAKAQAEVAVEKIKELKPTAETISAVGDTSAKLKKLDPQSDVTGIVYPDGRIEFISRSTPQPSTRYKQMSLFEDLIGVD